MSFLMQSLCLLALLCLVVTSVGASTSVKPSPTTASLPSTARIASRKYAWELDSSAMLAKSTFKIKPAALVERCKAVVDKGIGLQNPDDLAEDFVFQFPIGTSCLRIDANAEKYTQLRYSELFQPNLPSLFTILTLKLAPSARRSILRPWVASALIRCSRALTRRCTRTSAATP